MPRQHVQQRTHRHHPPSFAPRETPESILQHLVDGADPRQIVPSLVAHLGRPGYSLLELLADAKQIKEKLAQDGMRKRLIDGWSRLDRAIEQCVALTTSSHEKFMDRTLHPFCHFDAAGTIVSANSKMLELHPDCVGRQLASYFGKKAADVRQAIAARPRRLLDLELEVGTGKLPVLAEFGEVATGSNNSGYALLVDMSNIVDAEHKALEAAPYGMLKLDADQHILYATQKAVDLVGLPREELIGLDTRRFLADKQSRETVNQQSQERKRGVGGEFTVRIKTNADKLVQLRITSTPNFDASGMSSGSILQMQPIDLSRARVELVTLVATISDHNELYDRILDVLRHFIAFDWANLFVYSPKRDYSRIVCTRGDPIDFVSRWFPTPPGYVDWLKQPVTWMDDMQAHMSTTASEYLERVDTKAAIKAGMKAIVCLPIRSGGRLIGGICLASKKANTYGAASRKILEDINLEQALLPLFDIVDRVEDHFINELVKDIARSEDMQQVAEKVVRGLADFYKFENVSIFKINALRAQIQLLAQAVGKHGGTPMPSGYSQSIKDGVLGLCYRRKGPVILTNRDDGSEASKAFIQVAKETRSELCIPITLFDRVLWILNLEDRLGDAFTPIELEKLQKVIEQMQATLERIFQSLILIKVLDVCPASIIITDQTHHILRCNRQARQMMQKDLVSAKDDLKTFLRLPPDKMASDPVATTFVGRKGKRTEVMASRFTLEEEYDQIVFMLQDIADLEWTAKFETLRAALAEATAQVRVPVSLVSSFVKRIGEETKDDGLQEVARKASRQLGRIELTYDRVLAAYEAQTLPAKQDVTVDIGQMLEHILNDLPQRERDTIKQSDRPAIVMVAVDPFRLFFCLNSALTYLLRARAAGQPIQISTQKRGGNVSVSMAAQVPKVVESHDLGAMIEATRAEISLGTDLLARIALDMGGEFIFKRDRSGRERSTLKLRAATSLGNDRLARIALEKGGETTSSDDNRGRQRLTLPRGASGGQRKRAS